MLNCVCMKLHFYNKLIFLYFKVFISMIKTNNNYGNGDNDSNNSFKRTKFVIFPPMNSSVWQ